MNELTSIPRRGPKAAARRQRILDRFRRSGLSAYAFAHEHPIPYTTLIHWLRKFPAAAEPISFAEVQLPAPTPEPLILELGGGARLRISSRDQLPLVVELLKLAQA